MSVTGFIKLEALFRKVASIDIKKGNARDITDIAKGKLLDLLIAAERNANMNGRDVIWESDVPITKGLAETMIVLKTINKEIDIHDYLVSITPIPMLKYPLSLELEKRLYIVNGALLVIMAKIMKELDYHDRTLVHDTISKTKIVMDLTF